MNTTKFTAQSLAALADQIGYTSNNLTIREFFADFADRYPDGATCQQIINEIHQSPRCILADIFLYCYHDTEIAEALTDAARNYRRNIDDFNDFTPWFIDNPRDVFYPVNNATDIYITGNDCSVAANLANVVNTGESNNIAVNTESQRCRIISTGDAANIAVNGNHCSISATGNFSTVSCIGRVNSFILGEYSQLTISSDQRVAVAATGKNGIKANTWYFVTYTADSIEIRDLYQEIADRTEDADEWVFMQFRLQLPESE